MTDFILTQSKEALQTILNVNETNVIDVFSTSESYASGDYVIYNNHLYKFTAAHSGAWTGSDATQTTFIEEVITINAMLGDVESLINAL